MRSFTDVQVHLTESLNQDFKLHGFPCPFLFKTIIEGEHLLAVVNDKLQWCSSYPLDKNNLKYAHDYIVLERTSLLESGG